MVVALSQFTWTFPGGKPKQEVTEVVLVNNVQKIIDITVPTGKIWILLRTKIVNCDDVGRNITVSKYKEAGKTNLIASFIRGIAVGASAVVYIPNPYVQATIASAIPDTILQNPEIFVAGNTLSITWAAGGASTGATDADGLVIEYLEIDAP